MFYDGIDFFKEFVTNPQQNKRERLQLNFLTMNKQIKLFETNSPKQRICKRKRRVFIYFLYIWRIYVKNMYESLGNENKIFHSSCLLNLTHVCVYMRVYICMYVCVYIYADRRGVRIEVELKLWVKTIE